MYMHLIKVECLHFFLKHFELRQIVEITADLKFFFNKLRFCDRHNFIKNNV